MSATWLLSESTKPARKLIVVLPTVKHFSPWIHFAEQFNELDANQNSLKSCVLPYLSAWHQDRFVNPTPIRRQRINALCEMTNARRPSLVIATIGSLAQMTVIPTDLRKSRLDLSRDSDCDLEELIKSLLALGYRKAHEVDEEGVFAVRGGILDVFLSHYSDPLRLEFFGDRLVSIRMFSITNQRSILDLDSIELSPAIEAVFGVDERESNAQKLYETLLEFEVSNSDRDGIMRAFRQGYDFDGLDMFLPKLRSEQCSAFHYLDENTTLLFPEPMQKCVDETKLLFQDFERAYSRDQSSARPALPVEEHFLSVEKVEQFLSRVAKIEAGNPLNADESSISLKSDLSPLTPPLRGSAGVDLFSSWLRVFGEVIDDFGGTVLILVSSGEQQQRLIHLIENRHKRVQPLTQPLVQALSSRLDRRQIYIGRGEIETYFWTREDSLLIVSETEILGLPAKSKRQRSSGKLQNYLSSFRDLKPGALVVHVDHGIGRYVGMTTLSVSGMSNDFLIIEYAGNDRLYLPVDKLSLLQRYSAGEGHESAALDRLQGQSWEKRKRSVRKAVKDMAKELLKIQAERAAAARLRYTDSDDEYLRFEAEFPFEETPDQLKAIQDVNADISSAKPMDRLICGDVGFGKTEVALRAAFRAVMSGFQVIVLVPTTVLCYQHYRTFRARLQDHGFVVSQVNRFVPAGDIKIALSDFADGKVDVLVGTHRILSKDVKPKRLGLLIVDEEQKFGVTHKERIKELRAACDVLTLTATPIPRTLHMAMVGLKDISVIATPPDDRLYVKTYIAKYDEMLVRDAIEHEMSRGGQVFYVYNRVEDIDEVVGSLRRLLPGVKVEYAHGQMPERSLERVIMDFIDQKFQVLVCTTIIESGVDMPHVNTLIVRHADRFGLAQLYQLRGRVGRSSRQAYAYFFADSERMNDEARKRLDVITAYQELGSGFQIASHDLEIRGAGNLLGAEQSGHAAAVGLDLYTQMLDGAIHEVTLGKRVRETQEPEIKLPISAIIPHDFIPEESQRLQIYKSLFSIENIEQLTVLREDLTDRFGQIPKSMERLLRVAELKRLLRIIRAELLQVNISRQYELRFGPLEEAEIKNLIQFAAHKENGCHLTSDYRLLFGDGPDCRQDEDKSLEWIIGKLELLALGKLG